MEEDIIDDFKSIVEESRTEDRTEYYIKLRNTLDLIESLINRNKELEERNIYLVNERKKLEELLFMSNENYIEKSLIKEKIDYYKKNYNMVGASSKVSVLEELLGEEK